MSGEQPPSKGIDSCIFFMSSVAVSLREKEIFQNLLIYLIGICLFQVPVAGYFVDFFLSLNRMAETTNLIYLAYVYSVFLHNAGLVLMSLNRFSVSVFPLQYSYVRGLSQKRPFRFGARGISSPCLPAFFCVQLRRSGSTSEAGSGLNQPPRGVQTTLSSFDYVCLF